MKKALLFLAIILYILAPVQGQESMSVQDSEHGSLILDYIEVNKAKYNLKDEDVSDLVILNQTYSRSTDITHYYINQSFQGIRLFNAISSVAIKDSKVFYFANRFLGNVTEQVNASNPMLSPQDAILRASNEYQLGQPVDLQQLEVIGKKYIFTSAGLSTQNIPVELVYVPSEDGLVLAWDMLIFKPDNSNWWSLRVDALSGELLDAKDLILTCNFDYSDDHSHHSHSTPAVLSSFEAMEAISAPLVDGSQYNVYPLPVESPNHGSRQIVTSPANTDASPFGWHDTDGVAGPEYTITRGNNVLAKEDRDGNNEEGVVGYSPDGTSNLVFDFPIDFSLAPIDYEDAAITNLFYGNNMMHDIWHAHGFDEQAGNFQEINYTGQGLGNDFVFADAQDGSGFNNANFGTPPDGFNPRMQMFLWTPPSGGNTNDRLEILNGTLTGNYTGVGANFGANLSPENPITSQLVLVEDPTGDPNDACQFISNFGELNNSIVMITRGGCEFGVKVLTAQTAGAVGVIVVNNEPTEPSVMGPGAVGNQVTIPSMMISQDLGNQIISALNAGESITASLRGPDLTGFIDGDFDNVIVAHEYGHGISNRLAGGPAAASCLFNDEQMGEGWSDWFGLLITMTAADLPEDGRGIGTFAISQPTTGQGIRPARYSTDFAINPATYEDSNFLSQPHGIGFVWATVLWDLTWAYIEKYGFDSDLYNGTGGNNRIMQLVIDGLKLQPCQPGFVDCRDALLAADMATTGGEDQCMIWEVFAARGLGINAQQGSSQNRADQMEDFTMPPSDDPSLANCSSLSVDDIVQQQFRVYPNPTDSQLFIETQANISDVMISLTDVNGRTVYNKRQNLINTVSINTLGLRAGIYILSITGDTKNYNQKVIKN